MVDEVDLMTTLEQILKIAKGAAPKIADLGAQGQVERIVGLADSALSRNQPPKGLGPDAQGGAPL